MFALGKTGSGSRTRTYDQSVNSRPLYQLSYSGMGTGTLSAISISSRVWIATGPAASSVVLRRVELAGSSRRVEMHAYQHRFRG